MSRVAPGGRPRLRASCTDLVLDTDLNRAETEGVLRLAEQIRRSPSRFRTALAGRILALVFEKPSLRTRVTFEVAMKSMGGESIFLDSRGDPLGAREPVADVARNLERWVDGIAARTFLHSTVEDLARWAKIPVINALSDRAHPCQALADFLTLRDTFGRLKGLKLAYVGDGNNVAHSLLLTGSKLGVEVAVATPPGDGPDPGVVESAVNLGRQAGAKVRVVHDPEEVVAGAHAVYTDVWTSMGSEGEAEVRRKRFRPYQVTAKLFGKARSGAVFMHCLPAHRGEEVEAAVMDSPRSVVFDQAENRLHAQKALLWMLLANRPARRTRKA